MRKSLKLAAAAALAVSGLSSLTRADDAKVTVDTDSSKAESTLDRAEQKTSQAADAIKEKTDKVLAGEGLDGTAAAPDAEGIRDVLAQVAEASLTKNGLDDVVERFVDADRNRIGDAIKKNDADYNNLVAQFRDAWKAKYGQDFDITNEEAVFKPDHQVSIIQSEIADSARLAGDKSVNVNAKTDTDKSGNTAGANADVNVTNNTGIDVNGTGEKQAPADRNKNDAGRNTASVTIPESHGMPALKVAMIHEFPDSWRIDVPDTLDAAGVRSAATQSLQKCMSMKADWPADVNDAYLAVTHTLLDGYLGNQADSDQQPSSPATPRDTSGATGASGTVAQ